MSARLGLVSREGLGEALRGEFEAPAVQYASIALVVSAIGIGTAAFETGNIVGGAAGLETITGVSASLWGPLMGLVAGALLWTGDYELIERTFMALVAIMGLAFVISAVLVGPDLGALAGGFVPTIPAGSAYLIAGLIGTTVVGYNLFLHASTVQERWDGPADLGECRTDTVASVLGGGAITLSIVVTAAAVFPAGTEITDVGAMADQLEPLFGGWTLAFFGIGLFAAGFTSAMGAPLAGAYATAGALGWEGDLTSTRFRAVWMTILGVGIVGSALGFEPVEVIVFAQVTNGVLLPILAVFLLYAMNNDDLLGAYTNSRLQNALGAVVTLIVIGIGLRTLYDTLVL